MHLESDLTEELYQWGWWAQLCPSRSLNYPSQSPVIPVKLDKAALEVLTITDDRALEIDQAIACLFHGDEEVIKTIKLRFVCGMSYRQISTYLSAKNNKTVSKEKVQSMLDASVSWLSGYFYSRDKLEEIRKNGVDTV